MDIEILNEKYKKYKDSFYNKNKTYSKKRLMSKSEIEIYKKLTKIYKNQFYVFPQVCLSAFIKTPQEQKRTELYRHPDFLICDMAYNPRVVIELNGKSHNSPYTHLRDLSVKQILKDCNIPLIPIPSTDISEEILKKIIDKELIYTQKEN